MSLQEFEDTLQQTTPPAVAPSLLALWHDAKGDWEAAHNIAQDIHTTDGSWVHAYLHRKEGDISNAHYWYRLAKKPAHSGTLTQEWKELATVFLSH